MKKLILKTAFVFVTLMLSVQIGCIVTDVFYPKGTKTITNLITAVYNQIG